MPTPRLTQMRHQERKRVYSLSARGQQLPQPVGAVRLHTARSGLQVIVGNGLAEAEFRQISRGYMHVPRFWGVFGWARRKG